MSEFPPPDSVYLIKGRNQFSRKRWGRDLGGGTRGSSAAGCAWPVTHVGTGPEEQAVVCRGGRLASPAEATVGSSQNFSLDSL